MSTIYGVLGWLQTIYAFSERFQEKAKDFAFILEWPWYIWVTLVLTTMLVAALEGAYRKISAEEEQLQAHQGRLEITPRLARDNETISVLPIPRKDSAGRELEAATAVWCDLSILVTNHDVHLTTIRRLWLCVSDPVTGKEIAPLPDGELGPVGTFMPPKEEFRPLDGLIEAHRVREFELEFIAYYPGRVLQWAREESVRPIALCTEATGIGMVRCQLPDKLFAAPKIVPVPWPDEPATPSEDPPRSTASEQAPPSSPKSSG